ncbi:MAG: tetratricopeptide repeat protein [Thioalkalispiraceae bacterium]|jgi:predicted Zn-dependent protease
MVVSRLRYLLLASLVLVLSACGSLQSRDDSYVVEPASELESTQKVRPQVGTSKAVLALLSQARQAALQGELNRAESFLERALRIEPRNAVLWHYMAKLRLNQGRLKQAAGLAAKSNSLDAGNKTLQADNWRIIAHARHQAGDIAGARAAQQKADALGNP